MYNMIKMNKISIIILTMITFFIGFVFISNFDYEAITAQKEPKNTGGCNSGAENVGGCPDFFDSGVTVVGPGLGSSSKTPVPAKEPYDPNDPDCEEKKNHVKELVNDVVAKAKK